MKEQSTITRKNIWLFVAMYVVAGVMSLIIAAVGLHSTVYTMAGAAATAFVFVVVLPLVTWLSVMRPKLTHMATALLNIAAFTAFIYYVGAYNPFVMLWAVVLIMSYLYSGLVMFIVSVCLLLIETTMVLALFHEHLPESVSQEQFIIYVVLSYVLALLVVVLSYALVRMIARSNDKTKKLAASQQAEEVQLSRLNTLLNSISDTVLTLNRYGRVTSENSAALSFFDTNQSLVGKNIDDLLPLKDAALEPVSIRKMAQNSNSSVFRDDLSVWAEGETDVMRLSVQISPIHGKYGDEEGGCVVIIRDITRQKTLEDEKDEFISVTSHELRTPIAIAEGSLSNLLYAFEKHTDPKQLMASAVAAHDQILYLSRMINDLSTLSRAERGVGDTPEEIDLNNLLQELYLRYQPEASEKSLQLNIDLDHLPTITTSRLYLEEILQNFLTNAIKYTKEGTVKLSGKVVNGQVEFSVTDSGIGISKADQEKIFDKFFRSEDYRTRETSGTGLGLYVVRKLADKLNTKVRVESRLNHGSTFSFTLPPTPASPLPAAVGVSTNDTKTTTM